MLLLPLLKISGAGIGTFLVLALYLWDGKGIASVLDLLVSVPTCMMRPKRARC